MKNILLMCVLASTALAASPGTPEKVGRATRTGSVEGLTEYTWPNGFRALFIPDPSKSTTQLNLVVLVGSRQETYGSQGIAHLFEHMLFKKTKKYPSIKDVLSKLGAKANGVTWWDRTNYFEQFAATDANLDLAISMEAERLRSAIISRDQLKTEMTVVRNELERADSIAGRTLRRVALSSAYRWHNYGKTTLGAVSDLENVPNEKLLEWYATYYQPDNALLIISGRYNLARALAKIDATFGRMPKPRRVIPETYTVEPVQEGNKAVTLQRVGGVPIIQAVYHTPAQAHGDAAALAVLRRTLISAPDGLLYKELVATGKASAVNCIGMITVEPAYVVCEAVLKAGQDTAQAKEVFLKALEHGAAPSELAVGRAKSRELRAVDVQQNDVHALSIALTEYASADWRYFFKFRDDLEKVTAADVERVAKKYLIQSNRTFGEYIPTEKPVRVTVPNRAADPRAEIQSYQGRKTFSSGEDFNATYANIEARTTRGKLPGGTAYALLPKKTRGESVRVVIAMNFGSESSLEGRASDARMTHLLLGRGTKTKTRAEFEQALDDLRAQLVLDVDYLFDQSAVVRLEVQRENLDAALALVGEMLRTPALDADELRGLLGERIGELTTLKFDPTFLVWVVSGQTITPLRPGAFRYTMVPSEEIESTKAVTVERVRDFYQRFYGGTYTSVAVVGDFEPEKVKARLGTIFNDWKTPEKYEFFPLPYVDGINAKKVIQVSDKPIAATLMGRWIPVDDEAPQAAALRLGGWILGGGFLTGRIPQRLREKEGLSYTATALVDPFVRHGKMVALAYASYAPEMKDRVAAAMKDELTKVANGSVTEAELRRAKDSYRQSRLMRLGNDATVAEQLAILFRFDRTLRFDEEFDKRVEAVKLSDLNGAFKQYFDVNKMVEVSAGDFAKKSP